MIVDGGILELQSFTRTGTGSYPNYMFFGRNDTLGSVFTGTETISLFGSGSDFIRKSVTWSKTNLTSVCEINLTTTDCTGSIITHLGLVNGTSLGVGSMLSLHSTSIGSKNETFEVQVTGEMVYTRP